MEELGPSELLGPGFRWTDAMAEALERDGHVVLPAVCPPATVSKLTAATQRLQREAAAHTITEPAALAVMEQMQRTDATPEEQKRASVILIAQLFIRLDTPRTNLKNSR